ncbi:MAG: hypothetical protein RL520_2096 [Pseudomonadota bacterium]|jgi:hypothetical protein
MPNRPRNEYVFLPYKRALFQLQSLVPKRICVFQQICYLILSIFLFLNLLICLMIASLSFQ